MVLWSMWNPGRFQKEAWLQHGFTDDLSFPPADSSRVFRGFSCAARPLKLWLLVMDFVVHLQGWRCWSGCAAEGDSA